MQAQLTRSPEVLDMVRQWAGEFERLLAAGMRSMRAQWDAEGSDQPLTLLANRNGVFVAEPGRGAVPAADWLGGGCEHSWERYFDRAFGGYLVRCSGCGVSRVSGGDAGGRHE